MIEKKTIFSLSSGRPPAGVAVVRVSGPAAGAALRALARRLPSPRRAALVRLRAPDGDAIDDALVLWFPAPASFTGEDVAELHVTGGPAVVAALLGALGGMDGLRPAEPGEFARRAFDNGKLDLTQAEGLADLIDAETEAQRRQALRQASGGLKALAEAWHARLLSILAETEAALDFGEDEEDVSARLVDDQGPGIAALGAEIDRHLARYRFAERLRRGLTIVLLGAPNAGKSSLINALARRDVAIVSPEAGTTRDLIEVHLDLGGVPATLVDTAGLRETEGVIEAEGVRRARARAEEADLVLFLVGPEGRDGDVPTGAVVVESKADLRPDPPEQGHEQEQRLRVSAITGEGLASLEALLVDHARRLAGSGQDALVTHERQRAALAECRDALGTAAGENDVVLRAESLRTAMRSLGRLTGRVGVEDILDIVFGRFCIGK
ncbi:tRNA uridine-5-carboxymethylaminomethyl(34) synthesis GTPase MnmE [Sphingosinicella microcystinivorans]|uniref:tRNA uridine-5-carboxymethylaminomethyl(34) synthesis GTPase MnmE n=1 Tax=Sphingosinicella microcystinivorans TaxID=335406 RepID=UPI0022F3DFE6|nr:tRNA uridine-5-carboxymethylaminomethyl(34) synthesis GTPase MnmE [Sphingosinicella microcystinivorans]WBX85467.1 tRNA uridine-5-carboxymethylaminomethyl(34) synthesis GTPase MnmE [Sphingosinicella microcystinivorans]